jgi:FMN reductase
MTSASSLTRASSDSVKTAVVVGNPKPKSRTLTAALAVADIVDETLGVSDRLIVDIADIGPDLLDTASVEVSRLTAAVAACDLVIVASPTFKATYSGLLKMFLDCYGRSGLGRTVAVPVMTAASPAHALAGDAHLRPLLVELGASVPTASVFFLESTFGDLSEVVGPWSERALPILDRALGRTRPVS